MKTISKIAMIGLTAICTNAIAASDTTGTQTTTAQQTATTQQTTGTQPMQTTTDAKAKGQAYLDANKKQPGVVTLPDGLQYKVITEGKGQKPSISDVVVVNYSGKLIDGTEFDSSYKRGEPATFPVGSVIPGWVEALQLMPVGSKWEVYIPSNLAYGEQGAPPAIGPNETLVFTIELLDAKKSS